MKLFKSIKKRLKVRTMIAIMLIIVMLPILLLSLYHPSGTDAATWNFDEGYGNPTDSSGSALATTLSGALWKTDDLCLSGKCLYFDGADDYVSTSSTTVFDAGGTYTVMAWIRPTFGGESATETFISKTGVVDFNISDTNDNVVVAYTGGTTASSNNSVITANKWHHVAITHNGTGTIAIYVDGNDQTSDASVTDSNSAASTLFGSELTAASTQSYQGFMDVVKIYTSQLTAAQIKAEYSSTAATESGISASVGSGQADSQAYLSDGLIGYWKMDDAGIDAEGEITVDSSGNGYSSTLYGDNASGDNGTGMDCTANAKFGTGCDFDGTDDWVSPGSVISSSFTSSGSFTLSGWFNMDTSPSADNYVIGIRAGATNGLLGFGVNSSSKPTGSFGIGGANMLSITGSTTISTNTWYHIALTYDGNNNSSLYLNGVLEGTDSTPSISGMNLANGTFTIGAEQANSRTFNGKLDEVRAYKRTLSPAEISALYNWAPGPVGYWKMDEGSWNGTSNEVADTSTYANHGTAAADATTTVGKFGNGGTFDGTGDYAQTGASTSMDISGTSAITMSFWVKISSLPGSTVCPLSLTETGYNDTTHDKNFEINSSGIVSFYVYDGSEERATATSALSTSTWHHITGQFVGANDLRLYVDGQLVNKNTTAASTYDFTTPQLVFGGKLGGGCTTDFAGQIDDVRVYNYARTSSQIVQDMNAGHPLGGSPIGSQVGYWKFDEMANDTCSGGSNDVCNSSSLTTTLDGTSTASRTASGKLNAALDFDGTDDVVTITNTSSIDFDTGLSSGFTISAWVNPDTVGESSAGQIFQKGANTYCQLSSSTPFTVTCNLDYATTDANTSVSSAIPSGSWTHVAMSYNSTAETISIWINGRKRATSSAGTGGKAADTASLLIGGGTSNNFDGKIDDVKVYSSELTTAEMQIDYNYNSALAVSTGQTEDGVGTPPVGWWKLDENTGTSAYDSSGNGSTGTATGSPSYAPGKIGSAISLNGSSQYFSMGDPASGVLDFGTGSFSLSEWFKPGSSTLFNAKVVSKGAFAGSDGYEMLLDSSTADNQLTVTIGGDGFGGANFYLRTENGFTDTTAFHHVLFVFDTTNNKARIYIDGIPQVVHDDTGVSCNTIDSDGINSSTDSCTLITASSSTNFYLGFDGFNYADVTIDNVKVFNYALSQAQVAYDYNGGLPSAHYQMDECTGTTIYNNAVNAQGGAFGVNGTWSGASGGNTSAGTCTTSGAWFNGATGKFNSSLDFDGTDDAVSVTNASIIDLNDNLRNAFTFSTWIYPNSDGEGDVGKIFYKNASTYCQTDSDDGTFVDIQCQVDLATDASLNVADACRLNQWCHVAFSWTNDSDDEVTIWINGVATTSSAANSGDTAADTANLIIGGNATGASNTNAFDGQIDDFRVYPYELTAAQIKMVINQAAAARFGPATGTPQP